MPTTKRNTGRQPEWATSSEQFAQGTKDLPPQPVSASDDRLVPPNARRALQQLRFLVEIPEAEPVTCLWSGTDESGLDGDTPVRIPLGYITAVVGRTGLGKSLILADIAARTTRGAPMPGSTAVARPPMSVIWVNLEDRQGDSRRRLEAAGAHVGNLLTMNRHERDTTQQRRVILADGRPTIVEPTPENIRNWIGLVNDFCVAQPRVGLIVIDPITQWLKDNPYDLATVQRFMADYQAIAEEFDLAIVNVHHDTKSARDAVDAANGSGGFMSSARSVLYLGKHEDRTVLTSAKCNVGPMAGSLYYSVEAGPRVRWSDEECSVTADELAWSKGRDKSQPTSVSKAGQAAADIVDAVRDLGPATWAKIWEQIKGNGYGKSTATKARKTLTDSGTLVDHTAGSGANHTVVYRLGGVIQ